MPDPSSPARSVLAPPTFADARKAAERLRAVLPPTPLVPAAPGLGGEYLLLKVETLLPSGSYKVRGVWNAVSLLSDAEASRGVGTVSAGNTALAVAWAARRRGVPAFSLLPETAEPFRIEAFRAAGGEPRLVPVDELFAYLRERRFEREPRAFVHPWIEPRVHAGHASLAVEIVEAVPAFDSVFVPVGGGGLALGVAGALRDARPDVRVFAVEPSGCAAFAASRDAGRAVSAPCDTVCEGVAVPFVTPEVYDSLAPLVHRSVLVSDEETLRTAERLLMLQHLLAEPSGALAVAGALSVPVGERGRSIALVTGANVGPDGVRRILAMSESPDETGGVG